MRALYTARIHVSSLPPECFPHACAPLMINANSTDIGEKKKERERDSGDLAREEKSDTSTLIRMRESHSSLEEILLYPLLPDSNEWDRWEYGRGEGLQKVRFKRFEVITFRFMQVKEFREQPRTSFRLEKIPRFLSGNGEYIVMREQYNAEIANYTKWSTNLNDIRNFFEIKDAKVFDLDVLSLCFDKLTKETLWILYNTVLNNILIMIKIIPCKFQLFLRSIINYFLTETEKYYRYSWNITYGHRCKYS